MKKSELGITASLEDYLEAIYFLSKENSDVRVTDIATQLGISKPSVNRAINTLKSQEYVLHEHYGSLRLTDLGLKVAQDVAKRHMVLTNFLCDVIGVSSDIAEDEACLIEHYLSSDTIEKLSIYTDNVLSKKV